MIWPHAPAAAIAGRLGFGYTPAMQWTYKTKSTDWRLLVALTTALTIGCLGGGLFAFLDLPLPWMLGALAATMAASLAGVELAMPQTVRKPMIAIVGVMLGSAFTPDRLESLSTWLPSLITLPVYVLVIGALILLYLRRFSAFDGKTAFFAATPGGLSEMILLADQLGGDMRNVALFHSARLLLIVFSIPLLAGLFWELDPALPASADHALIRPFDLAILALLLVAGWALAIPLRLPSPPFMGPLIASSLAHVTGVTEASPPFVVVAAAQLVIGASVGCRFSGVPLRFILNALIIGTGGALIMVAITAIFGIGLHAATGYALPLLLLALIPGGFPEMSLIALSMGLDPAFVVTHHGFRVLLVVAFALPIFLRLKRSGWFDRHWSTAPADEEEAGVRVPQSSSTDMGRSARK